MTGKQLQAKRQRRGWAVADLAERIGVSPRTVEGWEQGRAIGGAARKLLKQIFKKP